MRLRAQQERKTCGQKKAAAFVELRPNHTHNAIHARHCQSLGVCAVAGKFLSVELTIFDVAAHFAIGTREASASIRVISQCKTG